MIKLETLLMKPKVFARLTGLTPEKFEMLVSQVAPLWEHFDLTRKTRMPRRRRIGGGPKRKLTIAERCFMLLVYYRSYVSHVFLGMLMNIDDASVSRNINPLMPLLAQVFRIPERNVVLGAQEILALVIDATEQETERRGGTGYSGKKKRRTVKTQIAVTPEGRISAVSKSVAGNVHDKKLYDRTRLITDRPIPRKADLAYIGTGCSTPVRKPRARDLTDQERSHNHVFSKERIVVEHAFAHLKTFHILKDRFRNTINTYNLIFKNIAGLRNLQIA